MSENPQKSRENGQSDEQPRAMVPNRGPDRDEMASDYLPESDDWLAKTALDLEDPQAVAAALQFDSMFPEVSGDDDELQTMIDDFVSDFLKGRTSIGGQSREEYTGILESMFGGKGGDKHPGDAFAEMLGATDDE